MHAPLNLVLALLSLPVASGQANTDEYNAGTYDKAAKDERERRSSDFRVDSGRDDKIHGLQDVMILLDQLHTVQKTKLTDMTSTYRKTEGTCEQKIQQLGARIAQKQVRSSDALEKKENSDAAAAAAKEAADAEKAAQTSANQDKIVYASICAKKHDQSTLDIDVRATSIQAFMDAIGFLRRGNEGTDHAIQEDSALDFLQVDHLQHLAKRFPSHAESFLQLGVEKKKDRIVDLLQNLAKKLQGDNANAESQHQLDIQNCASIDSALASEAANFEDRSLAFDSQKDDANADADNWNARYNQQKNDGMVYDAEQTETQNQCTDDKTFFTKMSSYLTQEVAALREGRDILHAYIKTLGKSVQTDMGVTGLGGSIDSSKLANPLARFDANAASSNPKQYSMFAQLRTEHRSADVMRSQVVSYLQSQSELLDSKVLAAVAARTGKVTSDTFKPIMKLMKDVMMGLVKGATEKQNDYNWCTRHVFENHVERRDAMKHMKAYYARLLTTNTDLQGVEKDKKDAQYELDMASVKVEELDTTWREDREYFTTTIADRTSTSLALKKCIEVLLSFYNSQTGRDRGDIVKLLNGSPVATSFRGAMVAHDSPFHGFEQKAASAASDDRDGQGLRGNELSNDDRTEVYDGLPERKLGDGIWMSEAGDPYSKIKKVDVVDLITNLRAICIQEIAQNRETLRARKLHWLAQSKIQYTNRASQSALVKAKTEESGYLQAQKTDQKDDLKITRDGLANALNFFDQSLQPRCIKAADISEKRGDKRVQEILALKQALNVITRYIESLI